MTLVVLVRAVSEMEYCKSTVSMHMNEFWQVVEGFVDFPVNNAG